MATTFALRNFGIAPDRAAQATTEGAWVRWSLIAVAVVFLGVFLVTVLRRGRRVAALRDWAVMGAVAAVLAIPSIITSAKLFGIAHYAVGGVIDLGLGNLAAPVSGWSSAGVRRTAPARSASRARAASRSTPGPRTRRAATRIPSRCAPRISASP